MNFNRQNRVILSISNLQKKSEELWSGPYLFYVDFTHILKQNTFFEAMHICTKIDIFKIFLWFFPCFAREKSSSIVRAVHKRRHQWEGAVKNNGLTVCR